METPRPPQASSSDMNAWQSVALVGEMGYLIAIPAFALGFGGAQLDKWLDKSPTFLMLGLTLALFFSSVAVYRRVRQLIQP